MQKRGHSLPHADLANGGLDVKARVLAVGLGRQPKRLLVARSKGAQRVLHTVAELAKDVFGHIIRILGDEIDPDPFGAYQPRHLFDLIQQNLGRAVKQKMRLVKEENQLGLVRVANLGKLLKKLAQQPEQKGRIEPWRGHQPICRQHIDAPAPVARQRHHILKRQRRFAKQPAAALVFKHQQTPLDRADRGHRDIAIAQAQTVFALPHPDQKRLKILQVQKRHPLLVRHAKGNIDDPLLRLGQLEEPRKQKRPHLRHGGPDRMALCAEQIPECDRKALIGIGVKADFFSPAHEGAMQFCLCTARLGQPRQIAFHIGHKDRHAHLGKAFGHDLQGDGLAGARCPRNQPVTVCVFQAQDLRRAVVNAAPAHKNTLCQNTSPA